MTIKLDQHIINPIMGLYIFSLFVWSNVADLYALSNMIGIVFIGLVWVETLLKNRPVRFNQYILIFLFFIFLNIVSVLYSVSPSHSFSTVRTLVLLFALMFSLANYIDSYSKIKFLMYSIILSGFVSTLMVFYNEGIELGVRMGRSLANVNLVAMNAGIALIFSLVLYFIYKKFLLATLIVGPIMLLMFLTGSRKSILFIFFGIPLFILLMNKITLKQFIILCASFVIVGVGLYWVIFNIDIIYNSVGRRFESFFDIYQNGDIDLSELGGRQNLRELALEWFPNRPFLGHGANGYRYLLGLERGGVGTYSHDNLLELLVNLGVLGAFVYYFGLGYLLFHLRKLIKTNTLLKPYAVAIATIILINIILSPTWVFYYDKLFAIILAFGSSLVALKTKIRN